MTEIDLTQLTPGEVQRVLELQRQQEQQREQARTNAADEARQRGLALLEAKRKLAADAEIADTILLEEHGMTRDDLDALTPEDRVRLAGMDADNLPMKKAKVYGRNGSVAVVDLNDPDSFDLQANAQVANRPSTFDPDELSPALRELYDADEGGDAQ